MDPSFPLSLKTDKHLISSIRRDLLNFNKDLFKSWTPSCRRTNRGRDVEMRRTPPLGVQTLETVEKGGGGPAGSPGSPGAF